MKPISFEFRKSHRFLRLIVLFYCILSCVYCFGHFMSWQVRFCNCSLLLPTVFVGFYHFDESWCYAYILPWSRYGDIRLGHQTEHPEYSLLSWFGMLFSVGLGLVCCIGGTEPLYHLCRPMGQAETVEAAKQAMSISFCIGIHAWALYCVVALSLVYFHYRRILPLSICSVLYPLIGQKSMANGACGRYPLRCLARCLGVTSLGLGAGCKSTQALAMCLVFPTMSQYSFV